MSALARAAYAALLAALAVFFAVRETRPPAPVPASAPLTTFSADRAMGHVRAIAQRPHPIGSLDHERVRQYLMAQLSALGLSPQVQAATAVGTRYRSAGRIQNILARVSGSQPSNLAVLLMAHYDGVPAGPAASDDGAGCAALLETLRALRAGQPLTHDVIALFTDGEEAGLLGAAAFVREHPWAKDVGVAINLEARGTTGRSYMFETGPGNLDVARVLRTVPSVSAGSVFTTVYRTLPNDTDLSELAVLGVPALNFAFADGVDRYHTSRDDMAHLDPGSLQHHGQQMLALARVFGHGPLPRPRTSDAVFFNLPPFGLVVYSEAWATPLAILAVGIVLVATLRLRREESSWIISIGLGKVGTIATGLFCYGIAWLVARVLLRVHASLGGAPAWSGVYAAALCVLAFAAALSVYALVRRRASADGAHTGALWIWALVSLLAAVRLPGVSYLLTWPLIVAGVEALTRRRAARVTAGWISAFLSLAILAPFIYILAAVMLGVTGAGGLVAAVLVGLTAWLLAPQLEVLIGPPIWRAPLVAVASALVLVGIGLFTVRYSAEHPRPSGLLYGVDANATDAWLATPPGTAQGQWTNDAFAGVAKAAWESGLPMRADARDAGSWLVRAMGERRTGLVTMRAPREAVDGPQGRITSDTTRANERHLTFSLRAPHGSLGLAMRLIGAPVLRATIDGRVIDTARYRLRSAAWTVDYVAPGDSDIALALVLPAGSHPDLELFARSASLPPSIAAAVPPRPASVAPVQWGDVTVVRRAFRL